MTRIGLLTTHHDPEGRLFDHIVRLLPTLQELYEKIIVRITANSDPRTIEVLREAGVQVEISNADGGIEYVGRTRRMLLADALATDLSYFHLCDFDRVVHWADFHREELVAVLAWLPTYDFIVLGRTERAFSSHPRVQRDTERIINFVYAQLNQDSWDVTAASRGVSRHAAALLLEHSTDDTIGNDGTWPMKLRQIGGVTIGYWPTNGLDFETADRYGGEVAERGGVEAWKASVDSDPLMWEQRLELARIEIAAMRKLHEQKQSS
jgi:hypothetical protein